MDLMISRKNEGDKTTICLEGVLNAAEAPVCSTRLNEIVDEGHKEVILDLKELRLIDSSGVGVIRAFFSRVKALGNTPRIVNLRDQPRAIFRLLRLDRIFPLT